MIHIKAQNFDLMTTPNHKMFGSNISNKKQKYNFYRADSLPYKFYIPRSCDWVGKEVDYFQIEDKKYLIQPFLKFLAFYLSDGYVSKQEENKKWNNYYQIRICQLDFKGRQIIKDTFRELGLEVKEQKNYLYVNDNILGNYVFQLGKCNEKYIPVEIKELSKKLLKIFLDTYSNFDGHISKRNKDRLNFSTTSKKMADDIGELILKIGKTPSYYLRGCKDKKMNIKGKIYTKRYDQWDIRQNLKTEFLFHKAYTKYEEVEYNDFVYCVELPKNHILYVRRGGRCSWSGNCHVISQYAREMDALDALEIWAGFEIRDKSFYYKVSESESKWADSFLSKYERPLIGIQLKSSTWVRTPKVSEIIRLIRMLRFNGFNVVVLDNGGFGFTDEGIINLASNYNIREVAAIIQKLDLMICPDSGLLHFAGHFKIPTIAIFGGSDPSCRLKYYDTVYPIYSGKNGCKEWPCWVHAYMCQFGAPAPCLEVIKAEMVFDKVKQILS